LENWSAFLKKCLDTKRAVLYRLLGQVTRTHLRVDLGSGNFRSQSAASPRWTFLCSEGGVYVSPRTIIPAILSGMWLPLSALAKRCPASVQFLSPSQGETVSSQESVDIRADLDPPLQPITSNAVQLQAQMTATGPAGAQILIGSGDLRSLANPDQIQALWNL